MSDNPKRKKQVYIPHPLRPRRLVWSLTVAALLGAISAFFFYPMILLWQARRDLVSGETERVRQGLVTLAEVTVQNQSLTKMTAGVFADLMADEKLGLGPALRDLAQETSGKNKRLVKAWAENMETTAGDDARFIALHRLITATGQWDEKIPLHHRLRADLLRAAQASANQRSDALTAFLIYDPAEVRQDPYWPILAKRLRQWAEPSEPPDVRATALALLTRLFEQAPAGLREQPLPGEVEVAYEIGLLLLTGPLDDAALWRKWLTVNLENWKAILPPTTQKVGSAEPTATQPLETSGERPFAAQSQPVKRKVLASSLPTSTTSQPVAASGDENTRTVLRMAQSLLSAGADLPKPQAVPAMPVAERRAVAAALRYAEGKILAQYAEVLLNEDQDPIVRARVCLAFLYQPSPAAREPLMKIATQAVNKPDLSDEAWIRGHPERTAALAALAVCRNPAQDDPALLDLLWKLGAPEMYYNEWIEELICTLRTLSVNPAPVTTRYDFAQLRTLSFSDNVPVWQLKREAARTWLIRSRLAATQPDQPPPAAEADQTKAGSKPASRPVWKDSQERLRPAATPQDAYLSLLREMDYYEPEDGPPAKAPAQKARLMAMFDAWQLGIFSAGQLTAMTRSLSLSERSAAALLAGIGREKTLPATLAQRLKAEADPLVRVYIKIAQGLLADPPDRAAIETAYYIADIPRPLLFWTDLAGGSRLPLDRLFTQQEFPLNLMQIDRFEEVVRAYFPSLPAVSLGADYELRRIGFSLQKCWWVVRAPMLWYDQRTRKWTEERNGREVGETSKPERRSGTR